MRKYSLALISIAFISACTPNANNKSASTSSEPKTEDEKTIYALGAALANNVREFKFNADEVKWLKTGFDAAANGATAPKDPKAPAAGELKVSVEEYMPKIQELQGKRMQQAAAIEKEAGAAYIAKAAAEPGATKTASGLVIIPIKEGTGPTPKPTDTVKVHYVGTLPTGTSFDSSVERGEPAQFPLDGVIPCWTEGVQQIKVGGKSKLICPSDLAYGDAGQPQQKIPGGAVLIFEVELLDIVKPEQPAASQPSSDNKKATKSK